MQTFFDAHYPSLDIQILGMNEHGEESANDLMNAEADLPWLQDVDADLNGNSDVWGGLWDITYRDVQIVDRDGEVVDIYNVTNNNLAEPAKFNELRDKFVSLAATPAASPWQSPIEPLDVDQDGLVAPLDALIAINALNSGQSGTLVGTPGNGDFPVDITGDGVLSPQDPLFIINHLNRDFVAPQAALSSTVVDDASPVDVVFASYDEADDDDDDD